MINSKNAEKIFKSRYAYNDTEEWQGLAARVGRGGAIVENGNRSKWEEKFSHMINEMLFLPGGRILRNMGRPRGTLFNCYVEPLEDSIEEIGDFQKNCGILWSEGGGVGCNSSFLRPEDAVIVQKGGASSGPLSFLKWANAGANCIKTGGARRAACLALMLVSHPDIFKFINTKLVEGELNCFNISVGVMEEFLDAVEANDKWNLKWHHKVWREVEAKEIWDLVLKNMVKCAEPGLINWDNLRNNNSYYFDPILSTNPCQPSWATVLTPNGISTIGDIKIGDKIWSEDGWVNVINKVNSGVKDVYRYRTNASIFYGTKNHKVLNKGEKTEVDKAVWIDILNGICPEFEFDQFDEQAVIDGLLIGDGSVHSPTEYPTIYLCIGKDDQDYFDSEIKNYLLENRTGIHDYAWTVKTNLTVDDIPLTYMRKVPDIYKFGSQNKVRSFLRGLFSANGSILTESGSKRIQLKSTSYQIIEDVQIMLSSLGIQSYITSNKGVIVQWENGPYKSKKSYDINITKGRFIFEKLIGFIQKYKQERLEKVNKVWLSKKNKFSYEINHKKYISTEEVFDITVDGEHHTYWTGGCNVSNCGEVPLGAHGVCCLGSLVLPKFIAQKNTNWKLMEETVYNAVRFLDNVIQVNRYPLTIPEIQRKAFDGRRIGLGFMGLGDYLFAKKVRYGSPEAIDEIEKLAKNIRNYAYEASIKIAEEKGAFPKFDTKMYSKAHFIRSLPASIRMDIKKYGIRNVSLMAIAPTGTISLLPEVTSSAEPLVYKAFMRHDEVGDRAYVHPIYQKIIENNEKTPNWFVDTTDLKPEDHFETQVIIQKYTDGAISKTINTPEGFKVEQLSHLLLEYIRDLKGVTLYVDGSREEQILVPIKSKKEVKKYLDEGKVHTDAEEVVCGTGTCEL